MQSNESGYDSAAESVSSSEAIRAVNSLVQADLHEARDALHDPPLLLYRDREAHWNNASYAPEKEFTEGGRCNGGCSPCLFHNARLGCPRGDACRYCHEHDIGAERVPHRPRKTLRHKIKRNAEDLLRRFDVSPERVHDELQAGRSPILQAQRAVKSPREESSNYNRQDRTGEVSLGCKSTRNRCTELQTLSPG